MNSTRGRRRKDPRLFSNRTNFCGQATPALWQIAAPERERLAGDHTTSYEFRMLKKALYAAARGCSGTLAAEDSSPPVAPLSELESLSKLRLPGQETAPDFPRILGEPIPTATPSRLGART